ncbi:MAG: hypothetical protein ABSC77_08845 [Terracidiphilus sp.]|jgi:hypothetical protein
MRERREELFNSAIANRLAEREQKDVSKDLLSKNTDAIRKSVRESYPFNIDRRRVVVYMSGGRTADGKTFEELTTLPHASAEIPRGFALRSAIADTEIKIELSLSRFHRDLEVDVTSDDRDFAQELFGRIENWVSDIQPKRWLQLWLKSDIVSIMATIAMVCCVIWVLVAMLTPIEGPSQVRQQARELVKQGVNSSNEIKALELLLSIESGYEPVRATSVLFHPGPKFWVYFAFVATVILTLRIPPKGAIGIWGGKRVLEWQRRWIRLVSISVPGLLITSFFIPMLMHLLGLPN